MWTNFSRMLYCFLKCDTPMTAQFKSVYPFSIYWLKKTEKKVLYSFAGSQDGVRQSTLFNVAVHPAEGCCAAT